MCPFFSIQVPALLRGNAIEQVSVAAAFAIYSMFIFTIVKKNFRSSLDFPPTF